MKKKIITGISAIGFSYLFYQQGWGINAGIFALIMIIGLVLVRRGQFTHGSSIYTSVLLLIGSLGLFFTGSTIAVISYMTLMVLLAGIALDARLSYLFAFMNGVVGLAISPITTIGSRIYRSKAQVSSERQDSSNHRMLLPIVIAVVVGTIFYSLYASSNPLISWLQYQIDWSVIDLGFIGMTLIGLVIMIGYFWTQSNTLLETYDLQNNNILYRRKHKNSAGLKSLFTERRIVVAVLWTVCVVLAYVNLSDLFVLFLGAIPEGLTYSQYVHQGFYGLLFSILLAMAILLWFFRGSLNFLRKKEIVIRPAIAWVIMNMLLVITTCWKNALYVHEYGLTYKRIVVFIFLISVLYGLIVILLKILKVRNMLYFLRSSFLGLVVMSFALALVPWDTVITQFNLNSELTKTNDLRYLFSLNRNQVSLFESMKTNPDLFSFDQSMLVEQRLIDYVTSQEDKGWQSATWLSIQAEHIMNEELNLN